MKTIFILMLFIAVISTSCHENQEPEITLIDHSFTGTFERRIGNESGQVANVELHFDNNTFEGTSNMQRYPAICNGTYEVIDNRIKFENSCFFTADFDWTLILNGEFVVQKDGDTVILTKEIGSGPQKITDVYTLKLMESQPL